MIVVGNDVILSGCYVECVVVGVFGDGYRNFVDESMLWFYGLGVFVVILSNWLILVSVCCIVILLLGW